MGYNMHMLTTTGDLYPQVVFARFMKRPNRFVAWVELEGREVICHVKTTGRCTELLVPGARVALAPAEGAGRKTGYDLVAVCKQDMWVNIDSQAPNRAALAWLRERYPGAEIRPEVTWGNSRLDFHVQGNDLSLFVEVKGCTLEVGDMGMFPGAPTERGVLHLKTLMACREDGHSALALYVVQMGHARWFRPHDRMHPLYGRTLRQAVAAGVHALAYNCLVTPQGMRIHRQIPVLLMGRPKPGPFMEEYIPRRG